ncbi:YfhO family protein [Vagococcus intermedius]|uniref:YfhO family protein n=1 Tax=Vagococcus intermedius TaxID=2991418 RepID=A0AAF0CVE5_9ENTE|nr:YfhO family protein [Vagococcus intermedius]WEG73572.1 YfhO family protein [Vagococcus intermedius]WEG75654.1 YfhO family protein [Vagococcus intermedius]
MCKDLKEGPLIEKLIKKYIARALLLVVVSLIFFLSLYGLTEWGYQSINNISWLLAIIGVNLVYYNSNKEGYMRNKYRILYIVFILATYALESFFLFGGIHIINFPILASKILSSILILSLIYTIKKISDNIYSPTLAKSNFIILYTLLFIGITSIVFFPVIFGGYALVYEGDGFSQHYTLFKNFREELLSIIKNGEFPAMWDWTYGVGSSWFSKYVYYNLGDIFSYLSILSPTKYLVQWFSFLVLLRAYLAGIAYYIFARTKLKGQTALIVTSIAYAYSPLVIMNITRHPFFINVMIIFPLLLLGIDLVVKNKKINLFILITAWAIINNFYFAWLMAIGGLLYLVLLYFNVYQKKESFWLFIKPFIVALFIVIGLVSVYIIPVLYNVSLMSRGEDIFANDLMIYNMQYYFRLPLDLINMNGGRALNFFGGYSVVFVLASVFIFRRIKEYRVLAGSLIIGIIIVLSPYLASIMSGMGSPVQRWMLIWNVPIALSIGFVLDNLKNIQKKDLTISIWLYILIIILSFIGEKFKMAQLNLTLPLICMMLCLVIIFCNKLNLLTLKMSKLCLAAIIIFNIFGNVWSYHSYNSIARIDKHTRTADYLEKSIADSFVGVENIIQTKPDQRLHMSNVDRLIPTKFFRGNTSSLLGVYQLNSYNSIENKYLNTMLYEGFGNENFPSAPFVVTKDMPILLRFMGVKYYVSKTNSYHPSGYEKIEEKESSKDIEITKANSVVPFAYASQDSILESEAEKLSQPARLNMLLDTVVTKNKTDISSHYKPKYDEVKQKIIKIKDKSTGEELKAIDNRYTFLAGHDYNVELDVEYLDKKDVFLSFDEASPVFVPKEMRLKRINTGNRTPYDNLKFYINNMFLFDDASINFRVKGTELVQGIYSEGKLSGNGYRKIKRQSYYMGKLDNNMSSSVSFSNKSENDLRISNLHFLTLQQDENIINKKIEKLNLNRLKNIKFTKNKVEGIISTKGTAMLATKIPYQPGWQAKVNGKVTDIQCVNYGFAGIELDSGDNEVVFTYQEPGLLIGLAITCSTLLILLISLGYMALSKSEKK